MAAGGPADHWLTDILYWKLTAFGEPHDSLIRDIVAFGSERKLDDGTSLGRSLDMLWTPRPGDEAARAAKLEQVAYMLQSLRDQLLQEANRRRLGGRRAAR